MTDLKPGPLDGVRVLDLTRVVAGPYCSMFLGDLGAEVVKVEQPGAGDDTRGWGPPFAGGESAYYLCINRNKRSLTLDLKSKRAVELLRQLVKVADVVIENFRPGTMERLGLGEHDLRKLNPRLIYASLTGFGADGPMSDWPGYDLIVQAWGGLMSITGTPDGEPVKVGVAIIDLVAGLMLGKSITAALFAREKIGVGQRIDTSLLEAEVASLINVGSNYLVGGKIPSRWGNAHPNIVPYQNFKTADGYLVIGVASEVIWKRFCQAIGRTDLTDDTRFANNSKRVENRAELIELLSETVSAARQRNLVQIIDRRRSSLRAGADYRSGLQGAASAASRDADGSRTSDGGKSSHGGDPREIFRDSRVGALAAAAARRAQRRDSQELARA